MAFQFLGEEPALHTPLYPFKIYRCNHCRALHVDRHGWGPPDRCSKCHNR